MCKKWKLHRHRCWVRERCDVRCCSAARRDVDNKMCGISDH